MYGRVVIKSYFLLVPLVLYLLLMYRMLETSCPESRQVFTDKNVLFLPSERNSRKIMQLGYNNETSNLEDLIYEIKQLENQRQSIEDILKHIRKRFVGDENKYMKSNINTNNNGDYNVNMNSGQSSTKHMINCTNIHLIQLQSKIGHGVSKQTFRGNFRGMPVAVKMVTRHQSEVKTCLNAINSSDPKSEEEKSKCFVHPTMKLMKEILLLEQLDHAGFVKLLGYCVRSEDSDTSDLSERGVVSVFELGQKLMLGNLQLDTWQERIRHAIDLANFLHYLKHSPLGSLRVRDFKEGHFLMVQTSIKMIDLDDVDNLEPNCDSYLIDNHNDKTSKTMCEFGLPCNQGLCIGFNAKQNLKYMNKIFFKRLLFPSMFPKTISEEIGALNADIDSHIITAYDITQRLKLLLRKGLKLND